MKPLISRNLLWIIPVSFLLGATLSSIQPGNWLKGWLSFSVLLLVAFLLFIYLYRWAGSGRTLGWMIGLAFSLRLITGVGTYLALPIDGYDEPDDRAGFFFTDAHRRDDQAWELADSDKPILSAFNKTYHTDQYGGLLAFISLAYRIFSPDAHRVILPFLLSGIIATLGIPLFWRATRLSFGDQIALVAGWILVLYPESLFLGGAAMREPYLITFGAMTLWGLVDWQFHHSRTAYPWLSLGLVGMLLVSPGVALITLIILAGWWWITREDSRFSWVSFFAIALVFIVGLTLLTWALNRQGNFGGGPLGVIGEWFNRAVKWDVYQLERGSGWVQKLFDEIPEWLRLPFVTIYGIFQPVLPAAFIEPTTLTWRIIGISRALGWYLLWPLLLYAFIAAWKNDQPSKRYLWLWITVISWMWIVLTALRGGGDQWDNPRYRGILLLWQALAAGYAIARFRLRTDSWLIRIFIVEGIFLIFFTQWYLSRYFHIGGQIPFGWMVSLITGISLIVLLGGEWLDHRRKKDSAA